MPNHRHARNAAKTVPFAAKLTRFLRATFVAALGSQANPFIETRSYTTAISCPDAHTVQKALNNNWDCHSGNYDNSTGTSGVFQIDSDFNHVLVTDLTLQSYCNEVDRPSAKVQLKRTAKLNSFNFENITNHDYQLEKPSNISMIFCSYPISYISAPVDTTSACLPSPLNFSECVLPASASDVVVAGLIYNGHCQTTGSQFTCGYTKSLSPLAGTWYSENQDVAFSYDNLANTISIIGEATSLYTTDDQEIKTAPCKMILTGNATDWLYVPDYLALPINQDLSINIDFKKIQLISTKPECQQYKQADTINLAPFNVKKWPFGTGMDFTNDAFGLITPTGAFKIIDSTQYPYTYMTFYKSQHGDVFFQDNQHNLLSVSSSFNSTAAPIVAEQANTACNLNLTATAPVSSLSLFRSAYNRRCGAQEDSIELNFYTNATTEILQCVNNIFQTYAQKTNVWPSDCAAQDDTTTLSSSSTGANVISTTSALTSKPPVTSSFSSSASIPSATSSSSTGSSNTDKANASNEETVNPTLTWIMMGAGITVVSALIGALVYKMHQKKNREKEQREVDSLCEQPYQRLPNAPSFGNQL